MTAKRTSGPRDRPSILGVSFEHPIAFWGGVICVTTGTLMQLPAYFDAKDMGYQMRGMGFDTTMSIGMAPMIVGVAITACGLFPRVSG